MQKNEPVFKWEVLIGDDKIEMTEKQYQQLVDAIDRNVKVLKFADKMINPTYFKSSKKIFKEEPKFASEYLDWSNMGEKVVSDEKATANREKMMSDIRKMLKEKNKDWKPVYKDEINREAVADVWEHLKSLISTLEFPVKDDSWKLDLSITKHSEGKETHSVEYRTKTIDLGDDYDNKFWAEANYIFCSVCKKEIRKQIVIYNDYESDCIVRSL
jgi:hypothetical protein